MKIILGMKTENEKGKIPMEMLGQIGRMTSSEENIGNPYSLPSALSPLENLETNCPAVPLKYFLKNSFCYSRSILVSLPQVTHVGSSDTDVRRICTINSFFCLVIFLLIPMTILVDDRLQYCKGY